MPPGGENGKCFKNQIGCLCIYNLIAVPIRDAEIRMFFIPLPGTESVRQNQNNDSAECAETSERIWTTDAPCKAALHLHVPRSSSRISPLMRYFNNGSFPFQRSEHKRNELIKKLVDPYMRLRAAFGMDEYAFERVWVETKGRGNSKRIYHLLMIFCDSYNCVLSVRWRQSIILCGEHFA
jgi:hypothetical protein